MEANAFVGNTWASAKTGYCFCALLDVPRIAREQAKAGAPVKNPQ
jgi:hypothetical protein